MEGQYDIYRGKQILDLLLKGWTAEYDVQLHVLPIKKITWLLGYMKFIFLLKDLRTAM